MSIQKVRIGIVGAGGNVRARHAPGFQAIDGVELVSVANRSRESGERFAQEFGITTVYDNWMELVEADDTDAICIGTWPNMHCAITLAALENDKHVLTEARMAANADEAHAMLEVSRSMTHLVTQIVPAPMTLWADQTVQGLIDEGYLGEILAVDLRAPQNNFVDAEGPLRFRQDRELSGYNILNMGIMYEVLARWIGQANKVVAMTKTAIKQRKDDDGHLRAVTVPDHVDILCEMACGAQAHLRFSAITGLAPGGEVWLFGSQGTIRVDMGGTKIYGGRRGESELKEIPIADEKRGAWRVEEEFINAIRGIEQVKLTPFDVGVHYMEWTEAVTRSAQTGEAVSLPL